MLLIALFVEWISIFCLPLLTTVYSSDFMLRDETRLDETTVLKNISGISELQCLHRCRRNPECKKSACYQLASS